MTDNGLKVSDIAPVGERPSDIIRGRVGSIISGTSSVMGSPLDGFPTTDGDLFVYDSVTDTWVIVNTSDFGMPLTVEDEGVDTGADADVLNFVGAGVTATGAGGTKTITIPGGASLWINVRDYGAIGDGTTDDTAAINLAVAALIAAGRGVLYFPAGTYKVTSALTTISVPCLVLGDGMYGVSKITCTSQTAVLFTTSVGGVSFAQLELDNTYAGTASAGAAIVATNCTLNEYTSLYIHDFYTGIDIEDSLVWKMRACHIGDVRKYGVRIRNTAVPDAGDWFISDSWIGNTVAADAAIRIESSGGGKIVNCKLNGDTSPNQFTYGIDLAVAASVDTSILLIANCSIESVGSHGIRGTTAAGTSKWTSIEIANCQFAIPSNTGKAISLVGTTAADFAHITIVGCLLGTSGTARSAITLTNCDDVILSALDLYTFNAYFTATTSTNVRDYTGGVAAGVTITGTPSSGQVPVASSGTAAAWGAAAGGVTGLAAPAFTLGTSNVAGSATTAPATDSTIAAFDATTPANVGTAATGSVAKAARRDHVHATGAGTPSTQTLGDAAATGSGPAAAMTDHKHAITRPALDDLSDVVITSAASGDHIRYDGSNFVNSALRWEPHVAYDGTVVLNGNGDPVMVEVI